MSETTPKKKGACSNCGSKLLVAEGPPSVVGGRPVAPQIRRCVQCGHAESYVPEPPPPQRQTPLPPVVPPLPQSYVPPKQAYVPPPAPPPPPPPQQVYTPPPQPVYTPPPQQQAQQPVAPAPPPKRSWPTGVVILLIVIPLLILICGAVGAGVVALFLKPVSTPPATPVPTPVTTWTSTPTVAPTATPTAPTPKPVTVPVSWRATDDGVIPAMINKDSVEDFLGMVQARSSTEFSVDAYDGDTFDRLWTAGPFPKPSLATAKAQLGATAGHAIVVDFEQTLHIYALSTGVEATTKKLTATATSLCTAPASPGQEHAAWVELQDGQNVMVDARAGTVTLAPRPAWCLARWSLGLPIDCLLHRPNAQCVGTSSTPTTITDFKLQYALEADGFGVALGAHESGTPYPVAVGYDPKTRAMLWKEDVPEKPAVARPWLWRIGDLEDGRAFVAYQLTSSQDRLASFDAKTGARKWDVEIPRERISFSPNKLKATKTRVYVMTYDLIGVFDAKTGVYRGSIGGT